MLSQGSGRKEKMHMGRLPASPAGLRVGPKAGRWTWLLQPCACLEQAQLPLRRAEPTQPHAGHGHCGLVPSARPCPSSSPRRRYLAQLQVGERAGVDEGLGDHGQTGVDVVCLVNVEHKLRVFQDVDPKPQW